MLCWATKALEMKNLNLWHPSIGIARLRQWNATTNCKGLGIGEACAFIVSG